MEITPEVLIWARESAGLSLEEARKNLNLKRVPHATLNDWEAGRAKPTYQQLEKLAYKVYKRPLALFFLPEPPPEEDLRKSFRSLPGEWVQELPSRIHFLVRKAQLLQLNLFDLHDGRNPAERRLFDEFPIKPERLQLEGIVLRVREFLGVSPKQQSQWDSEEAALKKWRDLLEQFGIWIFKDSFKEDNYCGFCLHDKEFPVIYLNNNMPKVRQIFTLFHELGHLLCSLGGIEMRQEKDLVEGLPPAEKKIEIFCNAFAGEFLVPKSSLQDDMRGKEEVQDMRALVEELAKKYWVSCEVILRRLLDSGFIPRRSYDERVKDLNSEGFQVRQSAGGNYYRTQVTYFGHRYLESVFRGLYQGRLEQEDLMDYLPDIKPNNVGRLEEVLLRAGES